MTAQIVAALAALLGAAGPVRPELVPPHPGHFGPAEALAFSPDGRTLASGGGRGDGQVILWSADDGAFVRSVSLGAEGVTHLAFAGDGRTFAAAGPGGAALWDAATGREVRKWYAAARCVAVSPDGARVALGTEDDGKFALALYDVAAPAAAWAAELKAEPRRAAWAADGKSLLIADESSVARFDAATGARSDPGLSSGGTAVEPRLAADGSLAILPGRAADDPRDGVFIWDVASARRWAGGPVGPTRVAELAPDGSAVVVGGTFARLPRGGAQRDVRVFPGLADAGAAAVAPGGRRVAAAVWGPPAPGGPESRIVLWDDQGAERAAIAGRMTRFLGLAVSPDGRHLAAGGYGSAVSVWDLSGGEPAALRGHTAPVTSVAFHPTKPLLITGSRDGTARVWERVSGREVVKLATGEGGCVGVGFDPAGGRAVTANQDGHIQVWDWAKAGVVFGWWMEGFLGPPQVTGAAFSPDGKRVLAASRESLEVYDVAARKFAEGGAFGDGRGAAFAPDGRLLLVRRDTRRVVALEAGDGRLPGGAPRLDEVASYRPLLEGWCVAAGPDGKRVFGGGEGGVGVVWDAATAKLTAAFTHDGPIAAAAFVPGGNLLATASFDGTVRLTDLAAPRERRQLLSLVSLNEGRDWLATTPDGLFDGSPGGTRAVRFRVGGAVRPADDFFDDFYRPGLVASAVKSARGGAEPPRPTVELSAAAPPVTRIVAPKPGEVAEPLAEVVVEVEDLGGGAAPPVLKQNGAQVAASGRPEASGKVIRQAFRVALAEGENVLEARSAGAAGVGDGPPARLVLRYNRPAERPRLLVVAVGVSAYAAEALRLKYAAADAGAVADLCRARGGKLYRDVRVFPVLDGAATARGIEEAVRAAAAGADPNDVLVVSLSGHGVALGNSYYFVPADFRPPADEAGMDRALREQGVSAADLGKWLSAVPALRRVLVLDTCHAGAATGELAALPRSVAALNRNQGAVVIAAAPAGQAAKEVDEVRHGLLTYSLLAGMGRASHGPLAAKRAAAGADGRVSALEWLLFASAEVPGLMERYFGAPQVVQYRTDGANFPLLPLSE